MYIRYTYISIYISIYIDIYIFQGGSVLKNPPANAGDTEDFGLIPGLGRSPGGGDGNHSSILAWKNFMDRGA